MKASSMSLRGPGWSMVILSLLVAFILTLCPIPGRVVWIRPAWILMVLVYWVVMFPGRFGVGMAWMLGVFLDVLNGTLLGEHALALTVAIFMIMRIRTRFRFFPILQQGLSILGVVFIYQIILFCMQGFLGQPLMNSWYWLAPFTSMLLWPWVFSMLHHCQCRFVTR